MLRNIISYFKEIYKFTDNPFVHRSYIFGSLMKNLIKNKNFWFSEKLYDTPVTRCELN